MATWNSDSPHAWLICTAHELQQMPEIARRPSYEEDCEWAIAIVALPSLVNDPKLFSGTLNQVLEDARNRLRNNYPDIYEELTGEKTTPENSHKRAQEQFERENASNWVVISASGDWKVGCPTGYMECIATLGGRRKRQGQAVPKERIFYITARAYEKRDLRFGYVIQPLDLLPTALLNGKDGDHYTTLMELVVHFANDTRFENFEIHPCLSTSQDEHGLVFLEQCNEDNPAISVWSVYGHLKEGGLECLADFETQTQAEAFHDLIVEVQGQWAQADEYYIAAGTRPTFAENEHLESYFEERISGGDIYGGQPLADDW